MIRYRDIQRYVHHLTYELPAMSKGELKDAIRRIDEMLSDMAIPEDPVTWDDIVYVDSFWRMGQLKNGSWVCLNDLDYLPRTATTHERKVYLHEPT